MAPIRKHTSIIKGYDFGARPEAWNYRPRLCRAAGCDCVRAVRRSGVPVIGFDIDRKRIDELRAGHDRTREVEPSDLSHPSLSYENDPAKLATCDFSIVTVPTPIDKANRPELSAIRAASQTVGEVLKRGDIVVYESTVYPGAIEEDCAPLLEKASGLKAGSDFVLAIHRSASIPAIKRIVLNRL
jgi:UDP-N-acetyl-D-glucosamine/UDP-N-acetyl-D-galactosamine dehydrogenase